MDISPFRELRIAPRAVFDGLAERAERPRFMVPDSDGWAPVTWQEFADQLRRTATWLAAQGLQPADRVAIYAANSVEWAAASLAIQAAGGVMVPIYPSCTAEDAQYVVRHSDARWVFVGSRALRGRLLGLPAEVRMIALDDGAELTGSDVRWEDAKADEPVDAFAARMNGISLDAPGLMLYTSGTSGRPKGVPLTHRNVAINGLDWLECNAPILHADGVDVLWLPMSHIFGFGEMCLGNTLGFLSWLSTPWEVLNHLPEVRPTVLMSVPSIWEKLAAGALSAGNSHEAQRAALDASTGGRLQFCLSGGAGLKREVKELFLEVGGVLIIEGYGLTEAAPTLTLNRPGAFRFDSVGQPLPSVELRLAGDGEILARGPNVFGGYHKDPEGTAAAFTADGWLKTGDIGRFTEDGFLQIVDRKKDILVTAGGKNIAPANIELRFTDDTVIEHVVVYGDSRRYLVAGVWLAPTAPGGEAAQEHVGARIAAVNRELARHETIKRFAVMEPALTVEGGLLTPTMKVKRRKVYEAFREGFEALYEAGA